MITLPDQLELLEFTAKHFSRDTLKDTYLIGCQHVLPSLYYLLKSAIHLGLPPVNQFDIIIGATGNNVMNKKMYQHLMKNVYLISASSSDREFEAVNLRKMVDRNSECHKSYNIQNINLVNSGFPLNFYGSDYDNVPLNDIQLTFSLLLAGICQRNSLYNGICELDKDIQYSILKKYFSLNSTAENIYEI